MTYPTYPNPRVTWQSFPDPCYDPQEKWGDCPFDLLSLLSDERMPAVDRIAAFANCTEVSDSAKRIFAVRCVRGTPLQDGRKSVDLITDPRSLNALDIAYKHAIGEASNEELSAALAAAWTAAWTAAQTAASEAAWYAAFDGARAAAWTAAWTAASEAAWDAARDAARDAAWAASWAAASEAAWAASWAAASEAAWAAALDGARAAQIEIAKSILE